MMNLDEYPLLTIFVVALIVILGASEIGRLLGVRATGRGGDDVSTLEGATLGLLATLAQRHRTICTAWPGRPDMSMKKLNVVAPTRIMNIMPIVTPVSHNPSLKFLKVSAPR